MKLRVHYFRMAEFISVIEVPDEQAESMLELSGDYRYYSPKEEDERASKLVDQADNWVDYGDHIENLSVTQFLDVNPNEEE